MQTQDAFLMSYKTKECKTLDWDKGEFTKLSSRSNQSPQTKIMTKMVYGWATNNSHSQDSSWSRFERSHHFPLYNIIYKWWHVLHWND
jgi:hypothetical protein